MTKCPRVATNSGNSLVALKKGPLPQDILLPSVCNCYNILLISLEFYGQNCSNYYTNLHHPQCEGCPLGCVIVSAPMSTVVLGGTTDMEHNTENVSPIAYLCSDLSSPVILSTGNVKNLSLCSWGFF